jgi:subfamily B ATP-binding cassette protein MsbA
MTKGMKKTDKELRLAILRFLWGFIRQDLRYLLGALFCAAGVSGMAALFAPLIALFGDILTNNSALHIDPAALTKKQHIPYRVALFEAHAAHTFVSSGNPITTICIIIVCIYAVRWFFTYGDTILFAEAGLRLTLRLRNAIYTHLQGLSLRYFNDQRTGALMSTINNDLPILQGALSGLKDVASAPFQLLFGITIIISISPQLSLVALLAFPFMAYTINRTTRVIRSLTMRTQNKQADVNALLAESLGAVRIIQSFSAEHYEIARFQKINRESKDLAMTSIRITSVLKPTIDLIGAVGIALALWEAGRLVAVEHTMTIGALIAFVYMLNQIAVGVGSIGGIRSTYESVMAAGERIWNNVLNVEPEIKDAPGAIDLPPVCGSVELRHVMFSYRPETPVLRDISFTINPGEVVALVGLSGAGKSTVADLIPRFYDPIEGAVLVDGHDLRTVTLSSLRRQIGIVPQETVLFGGTIRENIAYGDPNATEARIEAAARAANAHKFICEELTDGYDTLVGERGKQLSGGQRQRISIARALLKDPRILILDEATSSLDAESEHLVQLALNELMKGRTTLVIAHRLSTIVNAHKIVVLDAGRILETGTHADLIQRPDGHYARLYRKFAK